MSKSISIRWLAVNYFNHGAFRLSGLSTADDSVLFRSLLAQLDKGDDSNVYYCNNSGAVARFMTAILAITPGNHFLTGDERLCQRPMSDLVDALNEIGLHVQYAGTPGFLPLAIIGSQPNRKMVFVNASKSSQFISALLLMGMGMERGIRISLKSKTVSMSYVRMTMDILAQAGYDVRMHASSRTILLNPRTETLPTRKVIEIEPDWSSASYFYEVATFCPQLRLRFVGLRQQSIQGDSVVSDYFSRLGVITTDVHLPYRKQASSLRIQGGGPVEKRVYYTFRNCPDLVPAVAVACAYLGIGATFAGISTLRQKESDRVEALVCELSSLGAHIEVNAKGDLVLHASRRPLEPTRPINTYSDHRIAMAFAPLTLVIPQLEISDKNVVSKSFPQFWEQLNLCREALLKQQS